MSLQTIAQQIDSLVDDLTAKAREADSTAALQSVRTEALGKKGSLTAVMKQMGQLAGEDRPKAGKLVNEAKGRLAKILDERTSMLEMQERAEQLENEKLDVTLPGTAPRMGRRHPLQQTQEEIVETLTGLGFRVMSGPQIEDDWHNFEALNIPADHPARDMQDTFYFPGGLVLRTHTSPVQIRTMLKHEPSIAIICPGKVYRVDNDVSHSPQFMQVEGLLVDEKTTFGDLKGTLQYFVERLFGKGIATRFRPSYFPFVEPGAEMDISCLLCNGDGCRYCSHTGWVEVLGCGMVHKNVLKAGNIDPEKYQGFAFGVGVDRICNMKYGINDIRLLYENDIEFLRQF